MNALILETTCLDAAYGQVPALRGIDLRVAEGEAVALLGSNGAGKSTLLKVLAGLQPAKSGRIVFLGQPMDGVPAHQRARLGLVLVPEGRRLFPEMTVLENLMVGAASTDGRQSKHDLERVFELFPKLQERRTQIAGSLSGGEQQMLAVSRGLMARPRLLLLDEPSFGLAPRIAQELYRAVSALAASGMSLLLAEQNVRLALQTANCGYVLRTGQIVLQGTAAELAKRPDMPELYWGALSNREVS